MRDALERRMRRAEARRRLTPAATVLVASLLMCLPLPLGWAVMPHVALLAVILWASLQPRLMPSWAAFLLGILFDMLAGLPIGIHGLIFVLAVIGIRICESRIEAHSLLMDWLVAAGLTAALMLLKWQLLLFVGLNAPLLPLLAQAFLTILAYPLATALAARVQRRLIADAI